MAVATARLSATIGLPAQPFQHPVEREDLRPVGVRGGRRLVVQRGDGGLQLVRADRPPRQRSVTSAIPSAIAAASQRRAVLLGQRDQLPVRAGPGRAARASVSSIRRQQPGHLAVVGQQPVQLPGQPDRLRRSGPTRRSSPPLLAV